MENKPYPQGVSHTPYSNFQGFTLIELMLVIAIISIMVTAASLSFHKNPQDLVKEEAQRLKGLVILLQNESIFHSQEYGLGFTTQGYRFFKASDKDHNFWIPMEQDRLLRNQKIDKEIATSLYLENQEVVLEDPEEIKKDDEKENQKSQIQIFVLSSGEMTPFTYQLQYPGYAAIKISFDPLGRGKIEIEDEEE